MKQFADNIFRFTKNVGKFSERVENTLGKEEIALNKKIFFFCIVVSKDLHCRHVKRACLGKSYLAIYKCIDIGSLISLVNN